MHENHAAQHAATVNDAAAPVKDEPTGENRRPGARASILAGLTLGATAVAMIGSELSTVVSVE